MLCTAGESHIATISFLTQCTCHTQAHAHLNQGLQTRIDDHWWVSVVWSIGIRLYIFVGFSPLSLCFIWKYMHYTKMSNYISFFFLKTDFVYLEENVRCVFSELAFHVLCKEEINSKNTWHMDPLIMRHVLLKKSGVLSCALSTLLAAGHSLHSQFWVWLPGLSKWYRDSNQVWMILALLHKIVFTEALHRMH